MSKEIFNPQPKCKVYRNKDYLDWIDDGICRVCNCNSPTHHHIRRLKWGSGVGIKSHDLCCVRRCDCHGCHDPKHDDLFGCEAEIIGNLTDYFQERYGQDELIEVLMSAIHKRKEGRLK